MLRFLIFAILLGCTNLVLGQRSDIIQGELLVQLEEGSVFSNIDSKHIKLISEPLNIYLVTFDGSRSFENIKTTILKHNDVVAISPNMSVSLRQTPNDEHYSKQWNLMKIDIEKAWNVTTGGKTALGEEIVVAILDSGFDTNIQDLQENLYFNKDEGIGDSNGDGCPGDCGVDDDNDGKIDEDLFGRTPNHPLYNPAHAIDDDENGYLDDIRGLNLLDKTDQVSVNNHGTSVAGIIGAKGNNKISVSGINWDVKMMLLSDVSNVGQIVEAYTYIYNQRRIYNESDGKKGANVVVTNFSSGIDNVFGVDFPIWCDMYDLLGSVGVLSVGATTNKSTNVDEEGDLPSTCESSYLITVTNLRRDDTKPTAGFGKVHVDLGAPGNDAVTLEMGEPDNVGSFSGTSSATPHVAGAIALLHSIPCEAFAQYYKDHPERVNEIKDFVLNSVDPIADLVGVTVSEGRLNVYKTMVALKEFCPGGAGGELSIDHVFPNPSYQDEINIEYDGPDGEESYELFILDVLGKLIHRETFLAPLYGERVHRIQPPTLAGGVYYIIIRSESETASHKQIIIPY